MILLHAVVPSDVEDTGREGLAALAAGPVTVLYEERPEPPSDDREDVLEHGRRILALAAQVPLLPIRYGTTLTDTDELGAVAEERADEWSRRLAHLADRCELVVHLDVHGSAPAGRPDSGRAYLEARMARLRRRERALADVRRVLEPWSPETRVLPDQRRLAVLVARADAGPARDALAGWGDGQPDLEVVVSGPWPPFSFCEEDPS